jgi:DNA-binding GntR family transcriptional regulator
MFLYEDVKRRLRERIRTGVYSPGTRIPAESQLVSEFGVSAITIRRAIRDLMAEGLLLGRQGLGVFVAHTPRIIRTLGSESEAPLRDDMRRAGIEPHVKLLSQSLDPVDEHVRRLLRLPAHSRVYRFDKLIIGDDQPVALDSAFLPEHLGEMIKSEVQNEFIIPLLASHGVSIHHMDFQIEAGGASEQESSFLGLPTGIGVLVVTYTATDRRGNPALTGRGISRADAISYTFCTRPAAH